MTYNQPPKFVINPLNDIIKQAIDIAYRDTKHLKERDVRCPYCNTLVTQVFPDAKGHIRIKCQKCKAVLVFDLDSSQKNQRYGVGKTKYPSKH